MKILFKDYCTKLVCQELYALKLLQRYEGHSYSGPAHRALGVAQHIADIES